MRSDPQNPINPLRAAFYERLWYEEAMRMHKIAKFNARWLKKKPRTFWAKDISKKAQISIEELGYICGDKYSRWH